MKNRNPDSTIINNNNGGESAPMRMSLGAGDANKQQQDLRASGWTPNNGGATTNSGAGGLNSSFSAMNNSLSQKWMSKKNQIGAGASQQPLNSVHHQMSNTVSAGFN